MVRKILPALLGLIVISGLGTGLIFWQLRSSYRSRIIKKLEQATQSIPHILGKDYLDKIKDKKSVTDAEYQVVLDKLENYVKDVGEIIYIYVYTLDENDRIVEVADTPSAIEKIEESPFFSEYRSAPPTLINILKDGDSFTPRIVQAGDEYGDFLSYFQLYQNSRGKKFVLGADIELSLVKQNLWRLFYLSLAISITGTIAYGFVIYLFRDNTRKNVASLFVFITIFLVVLTITAKEYRQKVEDRLFMAARTVPEIIGEAYIDRAIKPESVSPEEFKTVIQRINNFTATIGVTYAFALRKQGDKIVYIADSTTTEELAQGFFAGYWGEYDTSPDLILPLFEEPGKATGSYQDEYGSFRSVFYSRYDSNNNIVVFGADLAQNKLRQERIIKFLSVLLVTIGYSSLLLLWHRCFGKSILAHQSLQSEGIPKQLFWKTVIISSSSIVIFLAAFYLFTQRLLYDSYNKLEGDELRSEIDRFKRLLEEEKRFIALRFADWAGWDDAYQFVQDGNQSFRKSNLIPDVAITLRINLLLYLNLDKEVVGGVTYNAITEKEEPQLTNKFRAYLEQHPRFFNFQSIKERQSNIGLVSLDGENFLLTVLPVVRSDLSGTPKGFLVVARKFDQLSVSDIARRQNLNLRIYGIEEASAIDRFQPIVNEIIETGNDHVNSSTDNFIYGYTVLKDIENQPVFFVRIVRKRDIFLKGKDIVDRVLLIALIGFGVVILSTNLIILQTSVLSRLLRLVQNLENQRNLRPDQLEKIPSSGNDEISYLIQTFNELLETNRRNNEKFMKIFRASPTAIMIVRVDDGQISEVNSGFENLFGYTAKEVIGKNIAEFGGWLLGADADRIMGTDQSNDFLRNIEVSIHNREGKQITCNLSTEIIVIDETSYILYNLSDISALKQLNDSVSRINSLLQAQQETSIEGILATDEQGLIVSFNQRFCQMWYINSALLYNNSIHEILNDRYISESLRDAIERAYNLESGAYSDEIPLEDGRVFDVRAQEIRSHNGKYYGQIWYFRDITTLVTIEDKLQQQYQQISRANDEIAKLYERLKVENLRMSAELNVARHLQETILPKTRELQAIQSVDIAAFMEPANEVGGDYYDVFYVDRTAYITIGDITGHGLDSGIIMLMVQATITTLIQVGLRPHEILTTLNAVLLKNLDRMGSDKSLTLAMLSVQEGKIRIIGQHEELLILRHNDRVERIDTNDLGFPIGLERDISPFLSYLETELMPGEVAILFTDGVTEAEDENGNFYGIDRLCEVALKYKRFSSQSICDKVVADIRQHMNDREVLDDITLIVIKQKCDYG